MRLYRISRTKRLIVVLLKKFKPNFICVKNLDDSTKMIRLTD